MSRLTASPFHKPSPFSVRPTLPPSPPDTDVMHGPTRPQSRNMPFGHSPAQEFDYPEVETRSRKGSSLVYNTSGLRESRERTVQRGPKSFVIVIPPTAFLSEHGQLGHTLASGPLHRLSQGILMPLFPTMYAQLSAIAKEFNFPSTTGICLYLQYTEAGITLTPRISDDSWPHLWANALEPRSTQPSLPISGRIEFDIDMHQARWYNIWLSSISPTRDHVEIPRSVSPSLILPRGGLAMHGRQDSRTTFADESMADEVHDRDLPGPSTAVRKHIPRKLSLVDRFDALSAKSGSRTAAPATISPPEMHLRAQDVRTHALSPIAQEEEPKTARQDLQTRVNNWRASASLQAPSPLLAVGQTSLDPMNMPNHIEIDEEKLNLDDFTWSISSLGPGDSPIESIASWDRVQSVHLDRRMEASVCLTPSICTSFGPPSDDMEFYYLPSPYLATPDIARRQLSDCPLTPSTVTSWGPDSWPASPLDLSGYSQAPSIHLQDRADFSRPNTPTTATTWGPPSVYAPSPVMEEFIRTPDIAERSFDAQRLLPSVAPMSPFRSHVWPYNSSSAQTLPQSPAFSAHIWPNTIDRVHVDVEHPSFRNHVWPHTAVQEERFSDFASVGIWPYNTGSSFTASPIWRHGWPYVSYATGSRPGYPHNLSCIYPAVTYSHATVPSLAYPWNLENIYPVREQSLYAGELGYPMNLRNIYPAVGPVAPVQTRGYPHDLMNIYRPVSTPGISSFRPTTGDASEYPWNLMNIYMTATVTSNAAPGYPQNLYAIYPPMPRESPSRQVPSAMYSHSGYPHDLTHIYPLRQDREQLEGRVGYPENLGLIYPPVHQRGAMTSDVSNAALGYPQNLFALYPPVNGDAAFSHAPFALRSQLGDPHNLKQIYPIRQGGDQPRSTAGAVDKRTGYPANLDFIYPPVHHLGSTNSQQHDSYPYNLLRLYEPKQLNSPSVENQDLYYPHNLLGIYAPSEQYASSLKTGYPHNLSNIYPRVGAGRINRAQGSEGYPYNLLDIYPPNRRAVHPMDHEGYRHNLSRIYPPSRRHASLQDEHRGEYPYNLLNIYPSYDQRGYKLQLSSSLLEYPWNVYSIYCPPCDSRLPQSGPDYPRNLLMIYPPTDGHRTAVASHRLTSHAGVGLEYPWNVYSIYHPPHDYRLPQSGSDYPHNLLMIYPPTDGHRAPAASPRLASRVDPGYPFNLMNIYANLRPSRDHASPYPWNLYQIYTAPSANEEYGVFISVERQRPAVQVTLPSTYPNIVLYAPIYPANLECIYPATTVTPFQQSVSQYPTFALYPSPSAHNDDTRRSAPTANTRRAPSRTHAELVALVISERSQRLWTSLRSNSEANGIRDHRKTHAELHSEVFLESVSFESSQHDTSPKRPRFILRPSWSKSRSPENSVDLSAVPSTSIQPMMPETRARIHPPGANGDVAKLAANENASHKDLASIRTSRLHGSRPSFPPPLAPSPSTRLPPVPGSPSSPSSSSQRVPRARLPSTPHPSGTRPHSTQPVRELPSPPGKVPFFDAEASSPSAQRRVGYTPSPNRAVSMALPSSPAVNLSRSNSSPKHSHSRRDSLVMQRIRAYNTGSVDEIPIETLSQFPAPPRPPLPVGKLDRSKLPFA